ncbi:MAG: rhomboid family intramembrane serine protease [Gracilimonas sp.]|uniref:rhomboid family intramembrane serine protease n=1 Tax=Gracilimonas sp. TaxID=1974203 RepID=UPI00198E2472|nr:rhomboid family intramembrane serine protease [Gracilimonas sp.]
MDNFSPNTSFTLFPPVIKNLLIINGLAFLLTKQVFGAGWTPIGAALAPYLVLNPLGEGFIPWQLVTYMFLHADLGHIFFNLFALWIFGQAIENLWGSKRFLIYYLLTGIGAAVIHMFIGGYFTYTLGASGAVFGILLAFGMMFPDRYIMLLIPPIPIKAKYFVAVYGLFELFNGLAMPNSGIAHFAHLGGLVVGFILIKYWGLKKPKDYI